METAKNPESENSPTFFPRQGDLLAHYGAILSLMEAGLGSLLHAFHIPCKGALLSLNQVFLITHALTSGAASKFLPASLSTLGAIGKSLAPCSKKLLPILAITMQGLLYNLGTLLLGNNLAGRMTGAILSSLWGWVQPLLFYFLIFGGGLFEGLLKANEKLTHYFQLPTHLLLSVLVSFLLVKITLAVCIVIFTPKLSPAFFEKYLQRITKFSLKKKPEESNKKISRIAWLSCKDICKPLFLSSIGLTALFFYFADSSPNWIVWGILRPLGFGFISFFLLRLLPIEKIAKHLKTS